MPLSTAFTRAVMPDTALYLAHTLPDTPDIPSQRRLGSLRSGDSPNSTSRHARFFHGIVYIGVYTLKRFLALSYAHSVMPASGTIRSEQRDH